MRELADSGTTVLLTTQYLEEADRLADRIALLDHGAVVAEGTPGELKNRVAPHRLELALADPPAYARAVRALGSRALHRDPGRLLVGVATDGTASRIRAVLDETDPHRTAITRFAVREATLDDVFLSLTAEEPRRGRD